MKLQQYYSVTAAENGKRPEQLLGDDQALRDFLDHRDDQRSRSRKLQRAISKSKKSKKSKLHVQATSILNVRDFESWRLVPSEFKTRNRWLRAGRKVPSHEQPTARVIYPKLIEGMTTFGPDTVVLDQTDDFTIISGEPTVLYHLNQTKPYHATPRTLAYWAFDELFMKHARKDCWIRKTDATTGEELEDWTTEIESDFAVKFRHRNLLTASVVRQHINQRQIIGVKGSDLTRFVVIDLDFHSRNLRVFEAQAEVLLDKFHGVGTWHYQVKRQDVTGLQMIYVFDKPKELAIVQQELRAILVELDAQHPELVAEAKAVGMRTLAELEIYPTLNNGNGVRLPLCRDREMLLDKPLPMVTHRKRQVQDVEAYIRWLANPNRQYMPKEKILGYLHYHAWEMDSPGKRAASQPATSRVGQIDQKQWRGNMRRWLYEFWVEGNANNLPLNEHIAVLCRLAAIQGYSETEITDRVTALVRGLPACANSCSSRLMNGQYRRIDNVVWSTAKYACQDNGHQTDSNKSTAILSAALLRWPGFDALDTATWTLPVAKTTVVPNWTGEQRRRLTAFFRRPLFIKDDGLIIRFLNGIVNLTIAKEKEGFGWGKEYLLKWMNSQFPEIKCAKDEKRQRIIKCLQEEGIIQVVYRGQARMYCTHWTLGTVARQALGITSDNQESETTTVTQGGPNATSVTSIYYGSLFQSEDLLESGCTVGDRGLSLAGSAARERQLHVDEAEP